MLAFISLTISFRGNYKSPWPGASQTWSTLFPDLPKAGPKKNQTFLVSPVFAVLDDLNIPGFPTRRLHKLDFPDPGAPKGIREKGRDDSIFSLV